MDYDPKKSSYIAAIEQFRASLEDLHAKWTLETVKHLALINIAGIAGATTLLQINDPTEASPFRLAIIAFFGGLIFAVIDFYLNSMSYWIKIKDADRVRLNISKAKTQDEILSCGVPDGKAGSRLLELAGITGWFSAICAISGSVIIGRNLLCSGTT